MPEPSVASVTSAVFSGDTITGERRESQTGLTLILYFNLSVESTEPMYTKIFAEKERQRGPLKRNRIARAKLVHEYRLSIFR